MKVLGRMGLTQGTFTLPLPPGFGDSCPLCEDLEDSQITGSNRILCTATPGSMSLVARCLEPVLRTAGLVLNLPSCCFGPPTVPLVYS